MDARLGPPAERPACHFDLTDTELATAATACRATAHRVGKRATEMENSTARPPLEPNSKRYATLAEKLEAVRRHSRSG
jgi:hypothetical protein